MDPLEIHSLRGVNPIWYCRKDHAPNQTLSTSQNAIAANGPMRTSLRSRDNPPNGDGKERKTRMKNTPRTQNAQNWAVEKIRKNKYNHRGVDGRRIRIGSPPLKSSFGNCRRSIGDSY